MPLGAAPLSPAGVQMIVAWIEAGAPPGAGPTAVATSTSSPTTVPTTTATPIETALPTVTATATAAPATVTGTAPATPTPTETVTPTETSTATPTATVTPTLTIAPGSTLAEIQSEIFTPRCAVPACHTDESAAFNGDLSLESGSAYEDLLGVLPQNFFARRDGLLRVDPGLAENSFLLRKLTGPGPGEGSPMPLLGDPLTAAEIEHIRAWIQRGALPDE